MERSLQKDNQEAAGDTAVDNTALAEVEDSEVLAASGSLSLSLGAVSGSVDSRDLIVPKLEIVQKVGPLSESFEGGSLILNKDAVIVPFDKKENRLTDELNLTVLSISKFYEESLPYDPSGNSPRARTFDTREAMVEAGLWVEWKNNEKPPAREVANVLILIQKPADIESLSFNIEYEDNSYALALWVLRSTAYRKAAKKILSAAAIELKVPTLLAGLWSLQIAQETIGGYQIYIPQLRLSGRNEPEFLDFMKETLSS